VAGTCKLYEDCVKYNFLKTLLEKYVSIYYHKAMDLELNIIENNIHHIKTIGNITLYNSSTICDLYHKLRTEGIESFIIDLGNTDYIDSSGIGALLHIHSSSEQRKINIRFINFTENVYKIIRLTHINNILPVSDNLDEAIEEINMIKNQQKYVIKQIIIDDDHELLSRNNKHFKEYHITLNDVRKISHMLALKAPAEIREVNLLEQQISELIKNAVKHGNKNNKDKSVKIWYSFSNMHAHLIVEDEGSGFKNIDEWNEFFRKKNILYNQQKYDELVDYLSFRTENSDYIDGGNALFAAIEYWNQGIVYNEKKNCVGVKRSY
jgi:serine/threonine-protein kinase RsbW